MSTIEPTLFPQLSLTARSGGHYSRSVRTDQVVEGCALSELGEPSLRRHQASDQSESNRPSFARSLPVGALTHFGPGVLPRGQLSEAKAAAPKAWSLETVYIQEPSGLSGVLARRWS